MDDVGDALRMIFKGLGVVLAVWYFANRKSKKREAEERAREAREARDAEAWTRAEDGLEPVLASRLELAVDDSRAEPWIEILRVGEEAASRRAEVALEALGVEALPALEHAQQDESLYVREVVERVIRRIERTQVYDTEPLVIEPPPDAQPVVEPEPLPECDAEPTPSSEQVLDDADLEAALHADVPDTEATPPRDTPRFDVAPDVAEPEPTSIEEAAIPFDVVVARLQEAAAAAGVGEDREALLEGLVDRLAALTLRLAKRERTSAYDASATHRDGRTLIGTLEGTDLPVAVRCATSDVAWADALEIGMSLDLDVRYARWDRIYDRATFEARGVRP